jgi:ABC-type polysaccharide/polyol phosphate transport system ATPase subunit
LCDQAAWINKGELQVVGQADFTIAAYLDSLTGLR